MHLHRREIVIGDFTLELRRTLMYGSLTRLKFSARVTWTRILRMLKAEPNASNLSPWIIGVTGSCLNCQSVRVGPPV